jgi:hypothetical protein
MLVNHRIFGAIIQPDLQSIALIPSVCPSSHSRHREIPLDWIVLFGKGSRRLPLSSFFFFFFAAREFQNFEFQILMSAAPTLAINAPDASIAAPGAVIIAVSLMLASRLLTESIRLPVMETILTKAARPDSRL